MRSSAWGKEDGRGETTTARKASWSSDPGMHALFIGPGRRSPVRNAARCFSLRNGANLSTSATSAICGPAKPAATSSRPKSAIRWCRPRRPPVAASKTEAPALRRAAKPITLPDEENRGSVRWRDLESWPRLAPCSQCGGLLASPGARGAIKDRQDHRALHARQRAGHPVAADVGPDPQGRRAEHRRREPARRRHPDRHRGSGQGRPGWPYRPSGRQLLRHQSAARPRHLRCRKGLRADLLSRRHADGARGPGLLALQDAPGPGRRHEGQARHGVRQRRPGLVAAHRDRSVAPRHRHHHQLRALRGQRSRYQRAAGRPCACGLGRLPDRGVAAQVGHIARPRHNLGQAHRFHAGHPVTERDRHQQICRPTSSTAMSPQRRRRRMR